eukprot:8360207-Pyramimonas_sp.AAC.1
MVALHRFDLFSLLDLDEGKTSAFLRRMEAGCGPASSPLPSGPSHRVNIVNMRYTSNPYPCACNAWSSPR